MKIQIENKLEKLKSIIDNITAVIPEIKETIGMIISYYGGVIDVIELLNEYDAETLFITYDGGNHSEYDSTLFNKIYSLRIENGKIMADTEFRNFEIKDLLFNDIIEIFMWLYETHKDGKLKEWIENNK